LVAKENAGAGVSLLHLQGRGSRKHQQYEHGEEMYPYKITSSTVSGGRRKKNVLEHTWKSGGRKGCSSLVAWGRCSRATCARYTEAPRKARERPKEYAFSTWGKGKLSWGTHRHPGWGARGLPRGEQVNTNVPASKERGAKGLNLTFPGETSANNSGVVGVVVGDSLDEREGSLCTESEW